MPTFEFMKVNLSFIYGSALPFGPPTHERYKDTLRTPPYRRVDIGFSYDVLHQKKKNGQIEQSFFKDMWISLEIFNLLGINNTVSYYWITDASSKTYAIPNYLTGRRLNFKIYAKF